MLDTKNQTPMMLQWAECKEVASDALLFFRLGDFYEAFHADAQIISQELDLTLTERQGIRMCGVPWHTVDNYLDRLVAKGYKIAIAEQVEDPKQTKTLVKRKITRTVSAGTVIASATVHEKRANFIAAIVMQSQRFGLALVDVTAGRICVFETQHVRDLLNELFRRSPKEILFLRKTYEEHKALFDELQLAFPFRLQLEDGKYFDERVQEDVLKRHFHVLSLDGFGLKDYAPSLCAAGALLSYLRDNFVPIEHIQQIAPVLAEDSLVLDRQTLVNLEIFEPSSGSKRSTSLFSLLDKSYTAMGSRMVREWLQHPLVDVQKIHMRQKAIQELLADMPSEQPFLHIKDLERLVIRLHAGCCGPREYAALRSALEHIPTLYEMLSKKTSIYVQSLVQQIMTFDGVVQLLRDALVEAPPAKVSDGGIFRCGWNDELDELLAIRHSSHEWLTAYQERIRHETGVKTAKVGYTKMFGYYIEVSKAQAEKMPDTFMRRQTLVNAERFLTSELKQFEDKILTADDRIQQLELQLFVQLKETIFPFLKSILTTARAIAQVDALIALARFSQQPRFVCPVVDTSNLIDIDSGRHPVIDVINTNGHFVPNDIFLDGDAQNLVILTGPNMAGKSTYIRQVALLVILAQIGAFVPAKRAHIGVVDKLFSRIGASDDLARGQSTFMVEMSETASILHQATDRSLVILDEIGRGTSTYDGISIAWAVAEYVISHPKKRAKTLFATHYYELTELEKASDRVMNATVAVSETENQIRFLHKIIPGKTDKSYGIHVAALAGLPQEVVARAQELLHGLEKKKDSMNNEYIVRSVPESLPCTLSSKESEVIQLLRGMDCNTMTPLDALNSLNNIIKILY